jgi:excisionase family DNA binding protein
MIAMADRLTERFLTVEEFASALSVAPDTVRRWIRGGRIAAVSIGGRRAGYRINEAELRRVLALPASDDRAAEAAADTRVAVPA